MKEYRQPNQEEVPEQDSYSRARTDLLMHQSTCLNCQQGKFCFHATLLKSKIDRTLIK